MANDYEKALQGLEGFTHIILLYHFHKAKKSELKVKPFLSEKKMGIFSVRAPNRPNAIGMSIVNLLEIKTTENNIELIFSGADM